MPIKRRPLPDRHTIGQLYEPAMTMIGENEARNYFGLLVDRHMYDDPNCTRAQAEEIERMNLGYFAGYYDTETRARVERLFHCAHPYFGTIAEQGPPTPEQAFNIGRAMGSWAKR